MSSSEWKVSSSSSDISANTNILERSLYSKFRNFLAGNVCCIWNWNRIFRLNGLFTNSVFLATSFPGSPSVATVRREPWERGCVFGWGGEGGWGDFIARTECFHLPLKEREGNWVELTFAKTSGTVTRGGGKLTNSWPARSQNQLRVAFRLQFRSPFLKWRVDCLTDISQHLFSKMEVNLNDLSRIWNQSSGQLLGAHEWAPPLISFRKRSMPFCWHLFYGLFFDSFHYERKQGIFICIQAWSVPLACYYIFTV